MLTFRVFMVQTVRSHQGKGELMPTGHFCYGRLEEEGQGADSQDICAAWNGGEAHVRRECRGPEGYRENNQRAAGSRLRTLRNGQFGVHVPRWDGGRWIADDHGAAERVG